MLKLPMAKMVAPGGLAKARWGGLIGRMRGVYQAGDNLASRAGMAVARNHINSPKGQAKIEEAGQKAGKQAFDESFAATSAPAVAAFTRHRDANSYNFGSFSATTKKGSARISRASEGIRNERTSLANDAFREAKKNARIKRVGNTMRAGDRWGRMAYRAGTAAAAVGAGAAAVSAGTSQLSEAQVKQRREAAKARWAKS